MKKEIFVVVIAILAVVNANLAFNNENSIVDLSLTNIMALAKGEYSCSICGNDARYCSCDYGITCDYASCRGKQCHYNTYNWVCPCEKNGNPLNFCS